MAAAYAVLELIPPGAVVVIPHNCYLGVAAAVDQRRRAPRLDGPAGRRRRHRPRCCGRPTDADLVWIESPTNPTIEVADLPGDRRRAAGPGPVRGGQHLRHPAAAAARSSPVRDIVLHSGTKFIAGHSDALLGALVTPADGDTERFAALDGIRRRGRRHARHRWRPTWPSAGCARCRCGWTRPRPAPGARRAAGRPPGRRAGPLPRAAGRSRATTVAARVMDGFGSLISIELDDATTADALIDACRLWVVRDQPRRGGVDPGAPPPLGSASCPRCPRV